ncbi:hypothetical protein PX699_00845 [Sphingobium sp. H39-3-25]|uniref:hypothetical protein n=1 Tax=Sphingobium arseniciresistens TaxID=3030834 RepID=UPI0023B94D46|nr:hypothetical protein [Sphingobium arseniciresistens]
MSQPMHACQRVLRSSAKAERMIDIDMPLRPDRTNHSSAHTGALTMWRASALPPQTPLPLSPPHIPCGKKE